MTLNRFGHLGKTNIMKTLQRIFQQRQFPKLLFSIGLIAGVLMLVQAGQVKAQQSRKGTTFTSVFTPAINTVTNQCKNDDENTSEGDTFRRLCKGTANYSLVLYGSDYCINYGIENSAHDFITYLLPLDDDGESSKYNRADKYDHKLSDKIEWRLANGKPFAVIVRVLFYKNTGSAKTFANPKNKAAEFVFVRGLKGFENLKYDLATVGTAYNPDEQARMLADKFFEEK